MGLFYYYQLNSYEKALYWKFEQAIAAYTSEIEIEEPICTLKRLEEISLMVMLDHPEYYWSKGSFDSMVINRRMRLRFSYLLPKADLDELNRIIISKVEQIKLDDKMSVQEKVNTLYEWVKRNVQYDEGKDSIGNKLNQTIYSVFISGKSLCMGIAKAFTFVLEIHNVDSIIVVGNIFDDKKVGHAWNMVKDDGYKQVDVTVGYSLFDTLWKKYHGEKSNRCIMVPFEYISKSHVVSEQYRYPNCIEILYDN